MSPLADARADGVASLEDDRLESALQQVRRGGQAHRAGTDHRDWKGICVGHDQRSYRKLSM
jgi:hypothetical protein